MNIIDSGIIVPLGAVIDLHAITMEQPSSIVQISGGSARLDFQKPDGSTVSLPLGLVNSGFGGEAHAVNDPSLFDQVGTWIVQELANLGAIGYRSINFYSFTVQANLTE